MNTDRILVQHLQLKNEVYPFIENVDRHKKTAQVKVAEDVTEKWSIHILLPDKFVQCIVDDNFYVCKIE